jgi:hypothetical protein
MPVSVTPGASAADQHGKVVGIAAVDTATVLDAEKHQYKIRLAGIDVFEEARAFDQDPMRAVVFRCGGLRRAPPSSACISVMTRWCWCSPRGLAKRQQKITCWTTAWRRCWICIGLRVGGKAKVRKFKNLAQEADGSSVVRP